uniref:Patatin-like phospholipase domain-containing protein 7 n=1 Tax=Opalina sp. OP10 TaxID=2666322 RepID=A0A649UYT1_9STRA|nr:patatin-like phospholipase domain-containing protein 7 [Opalina sp. OP10]
MGGLIFQIDGKISDKVEGALEAYTSGRCIYEQYKLLSNNNDNNIKNGKDVGILALNGDKLAIKAIEKIAYNLGIGIATIVACHNPEIVVIGGGVIELGDIFINKVKESFIEHAFPPLKNTPIEIATLGSYSNLAGAAVYALENIN